MSIIWIFLGIMSLIYGWITMNLKSGSGFFVIWYGGAAFFFLLAADRYFHFWEKLPGLLRRFLQGGFLVGILLLVIVEIMILGKFSETPEESVDYLVVLGAQVREKGPSRVLRYRLDVAAAYLEAHPETRCIVSGGQGANEPWSEAKGMRDYLVRKGIEEQRIVLEEKSGNTVQNITFSMALVDPERDRLCVVTNDFHMFRALFLARKQGLETVQGLSAPSDKFYLPQNMLREFFGVIKDFFSQNLRGDGKKGRK